MGYLYDFAQMILADNEVTEDEYVALKKYCKIFEFVDENIPQLADYLLDCAKKNIQKEHIIKEINS